MKKLKQVMKDFLSDTGMLMLYLALIVALFWYGVMSFLANIGFRWGPGA